MFNLRNESNQLLRTHYVFFVFNLKNNYYRDILRFSRFNLKNKSNQLRKRLDVTACQSDTYILGRGTAENEENAITAVDEISVGVQNPVAIIIPIGKITKDVHKFQCVGVVNKACPALSWLSSNEQLRISRLHMFSMDEAKKPPAYSITSYVG